MELHALQHGYIARYIQRGRLRGEGEGPRRASGERLGGQQLSRNAAQMIDVLGFCRSAVSRSS